MPINPMSDEGLASFYHGKLVLVTGANGFVAHYLIPRLITLGSTVYGIDLQEHSQIQGYGYHSCNLLDFIRINEVIEQCHPDLVFHLASKSSVGSSWTHAWETIECNTKSTYHLFKALDDYHHAVKLLLVSTGEVYGPIGNRKALESDNLNPMNPYAVSKASMEMIAHSFGDNNINYIIARSYNHTGPGRLETFFESSVAKRFAEAKMVNKSSVILNVGNIINIRDYSDVRDVVEKYLLLLCQAGNRSIYNVCSGNGIMLKDIIALLEQITGITAHIDVEESKLRKNDIPYFVGANSIEIETIPIDTTIRDLFESFLK